MRRKYRFELHGRRMAVVTIQRGELVLIFEAITGSHAIELLTARFKVLRFRLYGIENKSESDIASRWVHSETNLMFTLS